MHRIFYILLPLEKTTCCHILHRIYSTRIIIFGKNCVRQTFGPCLNLEASRCRWCECVKNCVLRLTYSLSYRSCTIHRNAVCVCVCVCVSMCVDVCVDVCISVEKKKFPDQRRPFWGTFLRKPSRIDFFFYFSPKFSLVPSMGLSAGGWRGCVQGRSPTTRRTPMTNRSIGSIKTIIVGCVNEVYALVQL